MTEDAIDRMLAAWTETDPRLDARALEVVGRLLLCARHLQHDLVVALRPFNVSFGDFDVINTLRRRGDEHGTNPRDLAQSALITSGAMTSRLDRLERRKLIARTPDLADGRAVRVRLTRAGEELAKQALGAVLAADEAFLEPVDEQQRDTVASALKQLLLARDERAIDEA